MAQYRAKIQGVRGEETRLGTKNSGMTATVQAWGGEVHVAMSHHNGIDCVRITLRQHGAIGGGIELYDGPVDGWHAAKVAA